MNGISPAAAASRGRRAVVHRMTAGRCFYCGLPLSRDNEPLSRDWILLKTFARMIIEHKTPVVRGGSDRLENCAPSCAACNAAKGALTVEEYRFVKGLRQGTLSFCFYGESPRPQRDWLCCHSREFESRLFGINMPTARVAYSRGRRGRVRR